MKNHLLFAIFLCLNFSLFAQIGYEEAYYINNSGKRHELLIRNTDWKNNPIEFKAKMTENSDPQTIGIETAKEFGVYGKSKYLRLRVRMDRSSEILSEMSYTHEPEFEEEEVYLKVLVEGETDLYYYEDGKLRRFFYRKADSEVEPLVYKTYKSEDKKLGKNNSYIYELYSEVRCGDKSIAEIQEVEYNMKDLVSYFADYNACKGSEITTYEENGNRDSFNFYIRPGLRLSSLKFKNSRTGSGNAELKNKLSYRIGAELESILPLHGGKVSLFVEPSLHYFKASSERRLETTGATQTVSVDYKSLEIPIGLRYYFFLNDGSRVFVNAAYVVDIEDAEASFDPGRTVELSSLNNLAFGLGYRFSDKLSTELRYSARRRFSTNYIYESADYHAISVILGYQLF